MGDEKFAFKTYFTITLGFSNYIGDWVNWDMVYMLHSIRECIVVWKFEIRIVDKLKVGRRAK